jgi:hypothetical protein
VETVAEEGQVRNRWWLDGYSVLFCDSVQIFQYGLAHLGRKRGSHSVCKIPLGYIIFKTVLVPSNFNLILLNCCDI